MSGKVRVLAITDEQLTSGDAKDLFRIFDQVVASPWKAKELRGSVFFEFGRFDKDPRPNHVIDEVRRYTQLIDQRYPYFLYFLPERPEFQQVYSWLASLATPTSPIAANAKGISVDPAAFATLAVARIHAIRSFCERILDDPADTEEGILAALPKQIAAEVRALVSRSA